MSATNRSTLRIILIAIYIGLILMLLPWLPLAVWALVFLSEPILDYSAIYIVSAKLIPFFIVAYPAFLAHGIISSWRAMGSERSAKIVIFKALYPLFTIIPVLLITILFLQK